MEKELESNGKKQEKMKEVRGVNKYERIIKDYK